MRRLPLVLTAAALTVLAGVGIPVAVHLRADPRDATAPAGPFWVDPDSQAAQRVAGDPALARLADEPTALTLDGSGDDGSRLAAAVAGARSAHRTLVVELYDLPHRDVGGGYSAGGAASSADYRAVTHRVAAALGATPTVLVLEPDSLGQLGDLSPADQQTRYDLLRDAVTTFGALPHTDVYLDGTNSAWLPADQMADRLRRADVADAQGFAVDVANYRPTDAEARRAEDVSGRTGGAHYVVDTSRNGPSPVAADPSQWCNPPGRRIGTAPTTHTGYPHADAYLWVKRPGESDGSCGEGQPPAGQWYQAGAAGLLAGTADRQSPAVTEH